LVIGGGNAALCAAMAARRCGADVLVLERGPEHMRGGNTRHTRNIRCAHDSADKFFSGPYTESEYMADLIQVTGGPANPDLAKLMIRVSTDLPQRMTENGARWQQPLAGTLHLGRTNRWFLGGGKAMLNTYYRTATRMGIRVEYDARVEDLVIDGESCDGALLRRGDKLEMVRARAVVVAAGGFEANLDWLKESWGEAAGNFIVRGTPYNDGMMLRALLKRGAKSIGDPKAIHAIAVDARSPKFDGGIATRLDAVVFGVVVNSDGRRFYDEGEDIWPKRYAIWGGLIADQPGQIAYSIVDSKMIDHFLPPMYAPYKADTIEGLAVQLGVNSDGMRETIAAFNRGAAGNLEAKMQVLDGVATRGLSPPKTNWALPVDRPPFYGMPLRPGITFTYMGVAVDELSRVQNLVGQPFRNVFAAGEIMTGNILTKGYLGGIGLAIGSIFGEIAGRTAANNGRA
jgi:tricarballylate dehydrogenase